MVGLAQGRDDLAFDVSAALRALGAIGAVIALRAEEVALSREKAALRERGLAPVAAEARWVEVDVVVDSKNL